MIDKDELAASFASEMLHNLRVNVGNDRKRRKEDEPAQSAEQPTIPETPGFEQWWSSTNNQNWFSNKSIDLKTLKETAYFSWRAGSATASIALAESALSQRDAEIERLRAELEKR